MTGRQRIVDAHHHVWDVSVRDQEWITARNWPRSGALSP
jgi:predicted TIM-barrel fold metal-dependent hydrolase